MARHVLSKVKIKKLHDINKTYKKLFELKSDILSHLEKGGFEFDSKIYDLIDELEDENLSLTELEDLILTIKSDYEDYINRDISTKPLDGDILETIANNFNGLLKKKGLTKTSVMDGLKITNRDYVNRISSADINLGVSRLKELGDIFEVPPAYFLENHDYSRWE